MEGSKKRLGAVRMLIRLRRRAQSARQHVLETPADSATTPNFTTTSSCFRNDFREARWSVDADGPGKLGKKVRVPNSAFCNANARPFQFCRAPPTRTFRNTANLPENLSDTEALGWPLQHYGWMLLPSQGATTARERRASKCTDCTNPPKCR